MRRLRKLALRLFLLTMCAFCAVAVFKMVTHKRDSASADGLTFSGSYAPLPLGNSSVSAVYERANPAVVRVTSIHLSKTADEDLDRLPENHPEVERERRSRGIGTGCIIDSTGYIVTNHHVIEQAEQIRVKLYDGTELDASLIGSDRITDLALLKINPIRPLTVMPLGDSEKVDVGEPVVAIGNPYSYERTVTTGIISAKGRKVFNTLYEEYLQTDAAINVGNSGGPLLNMLGELIGVNSVVRADANGISFAIPAHQIRKIVAQLRAHGHVVRGFLGIQPELVTEELRQALGLPSRNGALITHVTPNSAAATAGIQVYDVIVSFNGKRVDDKDALYRLIADTPPGEDVSIEVYRDRRLTRLIARLTEREATRQPKQREKIRKVNYGKLGFSVRDRGPETDRYLRVVGDPDLITGAVVAEIDPLCSAAEAGLQRGFLITEVNRRPVSSASDFENVVSSMKAGDVILVRVAGDTGNGQPYFITAFRLQE